MPVGIQSPSKTFWLLNEWFIQAVFQQKPWNLWNRTSRSWGLHIFQCKNLVGSGLRTSDSFSFFRNTPLITQSNACNLCWIMMKQGCAEHSFLFQQNYLCCNKIIRTFVLSFVFFEFHRPFVILLTSCDSTNPFNGSHKLRSRSFSFLSR